MTPLFNAGLSPSLPPYLPMTTYTSGSYVRGPLSLVAVALSLVVMLAVAALLKHVVDTFQNAVAGGERSSCDHTRVAVVTNECCSHTRVL